MRLMLGIVLLASIGGLGCGRGILESGSAKTAREAHEEEVEFERFASRHGATTTWPRMGHGGGLALSVA